MKEEKDKIDKKPFMDMKSSFDIKPDVKPSIDRKPNINGDDDEDLERIKPISLLHEMCAKKAIREPIWTLTQCSTNSCGSIPLFTYEVEVQLNKGPKLKVSGTANKKKTAKHTAAQNMLLLISEKTDEKTLAKKIAKPSIISETFFENFVGSLQRLCGINRWKTPHYTVPKQTGPPHCRAFICTCTVFIKYPGGRIDEIKSEGIGISMKLAKQEAAKNMRKLLIEKEPDCEDPERDLTKEENIKNESVKTELKPFTKPADTEEYDEDKNLSNQNNNNNNNNTLIQGLWETFEAYEERRKQHESTGQTDESNKTVNIKKEHIKTELVRFTKPVDTEEYDEDEDNYQNYSNNNSKTQGRWEPLESFEKRKRQESYEHNAYYNEDRNLQNQNYSNTNNNEAQESWETHDAYEERKRYESFRHREDYYEDRHLPNQSYLNNNNNNNNEAQGSWETFEAYDERRKQHELAGQTNESNKTVNIKKEHIKTELVRFTKPVDTEEYDEDEDDYLTNQNYLNNNNNNNSNNIIQNNNVEMNTEQLLPFDSNNNIRIKTENIIENNYNNDYNDTPSTNNQIKNNNNHFDINMIKVEKDNPPSDDDYCEILQEHILPNDYEMEVDNAITMNVNNNNININNNLQDKVKIKIENISIKQEFNNININNINNDNIIEKQSTNCDKKISEFHYSMYKNYGIDMRGIVLDKIRKMIMRIISCGKNQEPNFIDYQIIHLDEIMSIIDVDVNHNVFIGHDGSFIMVIQATTIPNIIEVEVGQDKNGFGTTAFFKVVERIKSLLN